MVEDQLNIEDLTKLNQDLWKRVEELETQLKQELAEEK